MNAIQTAAEKMLKDIDTSQGREISKACLVYNLPALNFIIKNGLVTVKGNKLSRAEYGTNTAVVYNF